MGWTVPGGRVFGIPIKLHLFLLVFFLIELVHTCELFGWHGLWIGLLQWVLIYVFILMHELGHCFAGEHQGGEAEEILLWPLGGLAMIGGVPQRPGPQIITNIAGPAVNLMFCILFATIMWIGGMAKYITMAMPIFGSFSVPWPFASGVGIVWYLVCYAFAVNLLNMLFNLIPAYPLDGGKVLVWSLTKKFGYHRAAMIGTTVGFTFAILLGLAGLFMRRPMLVLLAIFLWFSCRMERSALSAGGAHMEGDIFGYDFSGGYTTLADSGPDAAPRRRRRKPGPLRRWLDRRAARRREREMSEELAVRRRVDELLDKISQSGMDGLSDREKAFLKHASKRFGD